MKKLTALFAGLIMICTVFLLASCDEELVYEIADNVISNNEDIYKASDTPSSDTQSSDISPDIPSDTDNGTQNGGEIIGGGVHDDTPASSLIGVADARGSEGLSGNFGAAFSAERPNDENVIYGNIGNSVPYSIYASFSSPTVLTGFVITAPSEDAISMSGLTVDASVDGESWVTLYTLPDTLSDGKVYIYTVNDSTPYLYLRLRQAEKLRGEKLRFRSMLIRGIAQSGNGGDLSLIKEETDESVLVTMTAYAVSNTGTGNYADVFRDNASSWTADPSTEGNPHFLMAEMSEPTRITKITVKLWDYNRRPRGTVIQASNDQRTWTDLYTIEDLRQDDKVTVLESGEWTVYINDTTEYKYIRLVQREDLAPWNWTLNTVLIYGVTESGMSKLPVSNAGAVTVGVVYNSTCSNYETYSGSINSAASIWNTGDKSTQFTHDEHPSLTSREIYRIAGQFASPTVIKQINYYSPPAYAARVRTSYFEASIDGVTWVRIGTLPNWSELYRYRGVCTLTIDDSTAYSYIRIVQGENFYPYYWTLGTVEVIGIQ